MTADWINQDVHGLQIFVNQVTLVQLPQCRCETECDTEELPNLHRPANEATERLASGILKDEHQLLAVARDRARVSCPCRVQFITQRILVVYLVERFQRRVA